MNSILLTCGDVNGIGPEIIIKTLNALQRDAGTPNVPASEGSIRVFCPKSVFEYTARFVKPEFSYRFLSPDALADAESAGGISIVDICSGLYEAADQDVLPEKGRATRLSGHTAFEALRLAYEEIKNGRAGSVVTAPISKYALRLSGVDYPGHTEMFASWSRTDDYLMVFLSEKIRCTLLTIHEPLKNVASLITPGRLRSSVRTAVRMLREDLGIDAPKIAVLGLNPHAGENGTIGTEDALAGSIIREEFSEYCSGPYPSDGFFARRTYERFDLVLGMYHDQVLIPFKMLDEGRGVNYTAGLPFVRTSPDHGTGFDIAADYSADENSMLEAFRYALNISTNRERHADRRL